MAPVVLFASTEQKPEPWRAALNARIDGLDFRVWPDIGDPAEIDVALAWKPAPGALANLPNLKAILSLGAGVDSLLADPTLPRDVPLVRVVDDRLTAGMTEYVVHGVLHFHRRFDRMAEAQRGSRWAPPARPVTAKRRVGILGLGELGRDAARALVALGFPVRGWSRSAKTVAGVESFAGADGLGPFLAGTDILVCLLPLTPETEGIVNAGALARLPDGAYVINAARGGHVVDADLLAALDSGHLAGAMLDAFRTEPLPPDHPFWRHPRIIVTPHIASLTAVESAARALADSIHAALKGEALANVIERARGY